MRRRLLLASPLLALRLPAQPASPTVEQILDRYVEATGGKPSRLKVKTQVIKMRVEMPTQGIRGTGTSYRADGLSYSIMEIPGVGRMEEGVHGKLAWDKSALLGPRVKQGEERSTALRAAAFDSEWNWRRYFDAKLGEPSDTPEPCWVVILTPKDGTNPETRYYSKATGLLVRMTTKQKSQLGEIPLDLTLKDYRLTGGVKQPFHTTISMGPQRMEMITESVQDNAPIPPAMRLPPPEVRALTANAPAATPVAAPK